MNKIHVVVLMGGKSPEHEISLMSGRKVVQELNKDKYHIVPFVIPQTGKFSVDQLLELKPDVVFIAMHGPLGEDGTVQGLLELMGIPYTGAGVLASGLGMNKIFFKKIMKQEGILVSKDLIFEKNDDQKEIIKRFKFPLIVKPTNQGSSVGVSLVCHQKGLAVALALAFKYDKEILIEEYLVGTEISCGVLGNENPIALPIVEIIPKKEFFDYEAKYDEAKCEEIIPARISKELTKKVQDLAIKVFQAIGCQGFGRVDMIIQKNKPYVLEINTIPGLTPVSMFPKEAMSAGISYSRLLDRIIELGLEK